MSGYLRQELSLPLVLSVKLSFVESTGIPMIGINYVAIFIVALLNIFKFTCLAVYYTHNLS